MKLKMKFKAWSGKERIYEIEERPFRMSLSRQRMTVKRAFKTFEIPLNEQCLHVLKSQHEEQKLD